MTDEVILNVICCRSNAQVAGVSLSRRVFKFKLNPQSRFFSHPDNSMIGQKFEGMFVCAENAQTLHF